MGLMSRVAGVNRRDELTAKAINDAQALAARGMREFTVTVHSTYGGSALLPRLVPYVVEQLQLAGIGVANVNVDDWAYNAHINCKI